MKARVLLAVLAIILSGTAAFTIDQFKQLFANINGYKAHVMDSAHTPLPKTSAAYRYLPVYKFDRGAGSYCYPGFPSSQNDEKCVKDLDPNTPIFGLVTTCGELTVYTYWMWFGYQKSCGFYAPQSAHGDDWEHVSVHVNTKDGQIAKVVFHQHGDHYTRRRGKYNTEEGRPVVYIGKIAHGAYHEYCNGRCSWSEFWGKGCLGSVKYCQGGCPYWDDFRNPGPTLSTAVIYPLEPGKTIDGIKRPDKKVCESDIGTCEGVNYRALAGSGCWQDKP